MKIFYDLILYNYDRLQNIIKLIFLVIINFHHQNYDIFVW